MRMFYVIIKNAGKTYSFYTWAYNVIGACFTGKAILEKKGQLDNSAEVVIQAWQKV